MLYIIIVIITVTFILLTCLTQPTSPPLPGRRTSVHSVTFSESVLVCVLHFFFSRSPSFSVSVYAFVESPSCCDAVKKFCFVRIVFRARPRSVYIIFCRVVLSHQRVSKSIFVFHSTSTHNKLRSFIGQHASAIKNKQKKRVPCRMY